MVRLTDRQTDIIMDDGRADAHTHTHTHTHTIYISMGDKTKSWQRSTSMLLLLIRRKTRVG